MKEKESKRKRVKEIESRMKRANKKESKRKSRLVRGKLQ
jgi:hypothetical protein